MKASKVLEKILSGRTTNGRRSIDEIRADYLDTKIKSVSLRKQDEEHVKLEFFLENGRVFLKKFNRLSLKYLVWAHKKEGDEVTLLIDPDGIIRDIF